MFRIHFQFADLIVFVRSQGLISQRLSQAVGSFANVTSMRTMKTSCIRNEREWKERKKKERKGTLFKCLVVLALKH